MDLKEKLLVPKPLSYEFDSLTPNLPEALVKAQYDEYLKSIEEVNSLIEKANEAGLDDTWTHVVLGLEIDAKCERIRNIELFWGSLKPISKDFNSPEDNPRPDRDSELGREIFLAFGNIDELLNGDDYNELGWEYILGFKKTAVKMESEGWAWVAFNKSQQILEIQTTKGDEPLDVIFVPLFCIPMYEDFYSVHSSKANYVLAIW